MFLFASSLILLFPSGDFSIPPKCLNLLSYHHYLVNVCRIVSDSLFIKFLLLINLNYNLKYVKFNTYYYTFMYSYILMYVSLVLVILSHIIGSLMLKNILPNFSNYSQVELSNVIYSVLYRTENNFFILHLGHTFPLNNCFNSHVLT